MDNDKQFEKIGKKMPYHVPDGFFETITAKTLEKAKRRKQEHTLKVYFGVVSIAACAILAVVLLWPQGPEKDGNGQKAVAAAIPLEMDTSGYQVPAIHNEPPVTPEKANPQPLNVTATSQPPADPADEDLEQLLALLGGDELRELHSLITFEQELSADEFFYE